MARAKRILISLPPELLKTVERERRKRKQNRSAFFRDAVEELLRVEREREADERYIRAYREHPETEEDLAVSEAFLKAFAEGFEPDEFSKASAKARKTTKRSKARAGKA